MLDDYIFYTRAHTQCQNRQSSRNIYKHAVLYTEKLLHVETKNLLMPASISMLLSAQRENACPV